MNKKKTKKEKKERKKNKRKGKKKESLSVSPVSVHFYSDYFFFSFSFPVPFSSLFSRLSLLMLTSLPEDRALNKMEDTVAHLQFEITLKRVD